MSNAGTVLLKDGLVLTFKNDIPGPHAFQADVLIDNGIIADIAPGITLPAGKSAEIVDCKGKWITPGQIDTHRHVWMSIMRAQQADMLLSEYLLQQSCLQQGRMKADEIYIGQLVGCMEAINAGVTTVVDHAHMINTPDHAIKAIEATKRSGIRSKFCYSRQSTATTVDPALTFNNEEAFIGWQLEQIETLAKENNGKLSDRIDLGLAYDGLINYVGDKAVHEKVVGLARKYGLSPITAHAVGGPQSRFSYTIKNWYDAGLLKSDLLFSHANGLVHSRALPEEWSYLKEADAAISATPEDELGMAHGNPVTFDATERGIRCGLGVDCVSIVSADLFTQMRFALQWQRGVDNEALAAKGKALLHHKYKSADAFRLATLGGAEAIHEEHRLGSIEVNKLADIVILAADDSMNLAGSVDPFQAYVFWAKAEDVSDVLVNGDWVKRDGKLTKVEWKDVKHDFIDKCRQVEARRQTLDGERLYEKVIAGLGCPVQ